MESDLATLSKLLASTERRAAVLERENGALLVEINELDPSGNAERRARSNSMIQNDSRSMSCAGSRGGSFRESIIESTGTLLRSKSIVHDRGLSRLQTVQSVESVESLESERGSTQFPIVLLEKLEKRKSQWEIEKEPKSITVAPTKSKRADAAGRALVKGVGAMAKEKKMVSLQAGDLVWLRQKDDGRRGTVLGDCSLKTVGVQSDDAGATDYVPPLRFGDGVFRLCSHFNYRSKVEVSKITKAIRQSSDPVATARDLNLPLAKKRMASEAVQNTELLQRLIRSSPRDPKEPIRYGDVVQLQHVNSGLFLAVHKTPAPQNPTCRKVSLKAGSLAAHFKMLPKYKVRSIGSLVYADDEIVLQSVKHEGLYLGASDPTPSPGAQAGGKQIKIVPKNALKLRVPSLLRREANSEVNGAMELRSFTIKIYRRTKEKGNLLTGLHWFRLFHPEANAFLQASANPDKGQVLDALGTEADPIEVCRLGGMPAHVPYLKHLATSADASNPINLSAKAVWSFEHLDRTICAEVKWSSMPLRIRHIPSGKYLSVDSSEPTSVTPRGGTDFSADSNDVDDDIVAVFFDAALVDDADPSLEEGAFGSPSSMIFYVMPTDVTGATLREGTSAIRIEHRSKGTAGQNRVLYLVSPREPKPPMSGALGRCTGVETPASEVKRFGGLTMKQTGVRLCFTSEFSALHVLKVQPLSATEKFKLNRLLSYLPMFIKYSYSYHAGSMSPTGWAPLHLCVPVANQCLDLIDDLRKGVPPPRRHGTNMTEALKEANTLKPATFSLMFGGEQEPRMQKSACEIKLLDALFEAVVAPYNFAQQAHKDGKAFSGSTSIMPKAAHKFVYVAIQRVVFGNLMVQDYFSLRSSRSWVKNDLSTALIDMNGDMQSIAEDDNEALSPLSPIAKGELASSEEEFTLAERKWELWRNIIVAQGEDSLGALVTLGQLLRSSKAIVKKLVNNELVERFQWLLMQCGPEVRLINLFASICYVEKRPSRANQEMCVRKLWMDPANRYSFGVTFHEIDVPEKELPQLGIIYKPDGNPSNWPRVRAPGNAPSAYLGREAHNRFKQVCVAWTGTDDWQLSCGRLWFSPASLGVGPVIQTKHVEGVEHTVQLVPLEQLMWVIEPERLCKACTGGAWVPFSRKKKTVGRATGHKSNKQSSSEDKVSEMRQKRFENQLQLATYVIAELELLTQMCKGRSNNCIAWLEKSFSFGLLTNLATNPHLPYKFVATAMDFLQTLYVDRFPQMANSGAPALPEKLWVYHEESKGPRRSTTPVIQKVDLKHDAAFPTFFLSPLSSAAKNPDPVMSHPDHFKYYLLRSHCNNVVLSFGKAGRINHDLQSLNELGMAAIRGQQNLLKFGFQSTHAKLVDLCVPNGALLDGRSDLRAEGKVFDPPTARYRDEGSLSQVVTKLKKEVIATFVDIGDLRANFRLAQLLNIFKEKAQGWAQGENLPLTSHASSAGKSARDYMLQSTPAAVDALYADFEAMFPGGSGDGAKLDIAVLACKPDMDQALIDCMMYDDDNLMSAALRLLESNYGQRRMLRSALAEVTVLEHVRIPVYGDVHALRADLSELVYLARTSSVWGVKSRVAGPFGDDQFGFIMHIIDKVLVFMHTPYEDNKVQMGSRGKESSYSGHFTETDLQGNFYESKGLWSLDVANRWAPMLRDSSYMVDQQNQDILRSCNLQAIMLESVVLDPEIAWKGSICTDREKAESERRLTMVKRALLVCCTAFVSNNRKNQDIMFEKLNILEELATPPELVDVSETDGNAGLDSRTGVKGFTRMSVGFGNGNKEWPTTITELAQNVIITVLNGNSSLCEKISPTLVSLFSHIANISMDSSVDPVLEMLFILCKPESIPVVDFQSQVCSNLTAFERGEGLENLFQSLCACLDACASKSSSLEFQSDLRDCRVTSDEPVRTSITIMDADNRKLKDPERLVRLMSVVCEGGNEAAAAQLKQSCGISIDAVCIAIVSHLECCQARAITQNNLGALSNITEPELLPHAVLHLMSSPDSIGRSLLGLLVEIVFLLPLNHDQILSEHVWEFLEKCAVPLMEALGKCSHMEKHVLDVCTDLVDLVEHIFVFVVRLGLFRAVTENVNRERIIVNIAEDVTALLEKKEKTPEALRSAFIGECAQYNAAVLNKEQFVSLIMKLTVDEESSKSTTDLVSLAVSEAVKEAKKRLSFSDKHQQNRLNELDAAFEEADLDGNGEVDIYEFVALFSKVQSKGGSSNLMHAGGLRLVLRTVECGERILSIRMGKGHDLAAPMFSRQDQYGIRKGGGKQKKSNKLFQREGATMDGSSSSNNGNSKPSKNNGPLPLQSKFEIFQKAVQNNPRIVSALQRRRFTMVTILEKGTPGPPLVHGRSLSLIGQEAPANWLKRTSMQVGLAIPLKRATIRMSTVRASVAPVIEEEGEEEEEEDDEVPSTPAKMSPKAGVPLRGTRTSEVSFKMPAYMSRAPSCQEGESQMQKARKQKENNGNPMSGAVALTWEDITLRFVKYVTDHFWSAGNFHEDTCALVFETWNAHLIKARTWALDEEGHKLPATDIPKAATIQLRIPYDLSEFELDSFHRKQTELNSRGVTELLAIVISSLNHDLSEGALPDTAIELFNELLNGGNDQVQNTLYSHLVTVDTEGKLVEHMAKRLDKAFEGISEAKRNGRLGSNDDNKSADIKNDCEHAITTTRFLQLLCEGHHADFQNYLRCQPMYSGDVDLVKSVCNMLVFLCESTFVVSKFTYIELDLVAQLLNMLIDAQLGPCAGNQDLIAKSDVVASLNLIIHAVNERDAILSKQNPRYMGLRGLSCLLLAACLEGREDQAIHAYLVRRLEPQILQDFHAELEDNIWVLLSGSKTEARLPRPDEVERIKITQQFLVAVSTVLTELEKREPASAGGDKLGLSTGGAVFSTSALAPGSSGGEPKDQRQIMAAATKMLTGTKRKELVGRVEIAWRNKTERTCFPLPFEIKYLSAATKKAFLDEVDLSTSEKRMKALVKKTDHFVREMELIYHEAEQSKVYRVVHKHLPLVKLANYGLVFALNLNILLSPSSLSNPMLAVYEDLDGTRPLNVSERLSLLFTTVLGALCTFGYGLIITNLAVTELPLLIQELDDCIREDTEEAVATMNEQLEAAANNQASNAPTSLSLGLSTLQRITATAVKSNGKNRPLLASEGGPPVKRDLKAWLPLTYGLLVTVLYSALHAFNFPMNYGLYVGVVSFAAVPLTLSGLRNYVGSRPGSHKERAYAIVYDCIFRRSFMRNHVILGLCCFLGFFVNVEFFTLGLLDVVNNSPVISDIIKSVTTPGRALLLVFYLFCCTVLIFASFGMAHFHEALQAPTYDHATGDEGRLECKSTLSCFYLIFYHGLNQGGNLKENLLAANPGLNYFPRIVFDSTFFVWTGIVLMNIITGLMVDTFSSIREEKQSREDTLLNDCFVCGTLRNTYEDYALPSTAPGFDSHLAEDHSLWTYVYYIAYLKKKDPTEDSGIESYVRSQLEFYSLEWIPSRTGFVLEAEGKTGGQGAQDDGSSGGSSKSGGDVIDSAAVMKKMDRIITELSIHKED